MPYIRSTDGNNADNGSTWALSKAGVSGASAGDAAGDKWYVSQAHAESNASSSNPWAGTNASPTQVLCVSDAAEPPTTPATTGTITITGTTWSWQGAVYTYGLAFIFNSASSWAPAFNDTGGFKQTFERCKFRLDGANGGQLLVFGTGTGYQQNVTELRDCQFRFAAAGQRIHPYRDLIIRGGSWEAGGTAPTAVFVMATGARPQNLYVDGFDFTNIGSSANLIGIMNEGGTRARFRGCKLPASWTGVPVASGQMKMGSRVELFNCSSTDTNYSLWIEDFCGSIRHETTIVRSGGMSDGVTPLSLKMVSNANAAYPNTALESCEIALPNSTVGSPVTLSIQTITDGVTLTDADLHIEVAFAGDATSPLLSFADDGPTDALATPANQTTSTATWTTTGLTSPVKQVMSVTFTPQEAGALLIKVILARPSTTVFIDFELA